GKSTTGAKPLRTGRRRLLALPVLALLVVAVAATTAFARGGAVSWPTEAQETATSGVFTNLPFCGTKQITLGVHDGFGINAWSQAPCGPTGWSSCSTARGTSSSSAARRATRSPPAG